MTDTNPQAATNGSVRVPFDQRDGATSDVFFTRDLSAEGLRRAVAKVARSLPARLPSNCTPAKRTAPTSSRLAG